MSASISYRGRAERRRAGSFELTERDIDLLALVGLVGYASTEQLGREFFPSADRCRRRIRQLFDGQLVAVTLASSTKPNLVSLTRRALGLLAERRPALGERARLAGAIRLAGVRHHLAVVDARLYAAALGSGCGMPLVSWSNAGGDLMRELGLAFWHLVPDGVAVFATATGNRTIGVEVDCAGTESRSVLASKLDRHRQAVSAGALDELWMVVCAGAERRRGVEELVSAAGLGAVAQILDHRQLLIRPVAAPAGSAYRLGSARLAPQAASGPFPARRCTNTDGS